MRKVLHMLGELEDSDLQWLAAAGESRFVPKGREVIGESETQEHLFIVFAGCLSVIKPSGEASRLGVGEVFGDLSMLAARPANATVRAAEDSRVFAIPHATLRAKVSSDPLFGCRFYKALGVFMADRLNRADGKNGAGAKVEHLSSALEEDEIDVEVLEGLAAAGARFDWFRQAVEGM